MKKPVIALPGGVAPAAVRYAPLEAALGDEAEIHLKDLEVYAADQPPPGYGIDIETAALGRFADAAGLERFHLVGYSGGGCVSLAFAGLNPNRVLSLSLFEPARIPGQLTAEEATYYERLQRGLMAAQGPEFMEAFVKLQVREGVKVLPPGGPPSPEMRKRPAGLAAMMRAFSEYAFDRNVFLGCQFPVFLGYGDLTAEIEEIKAGVLARLFSNIKIRRFQGVHHFVPPEQVYIPEHTREIRELWTSSESRS